MIAPISSVYYFPAPHYDAANQLAVGVRFESLADAVEAADDLAEYFGCAYVVNMVAVGVAVCRVAEVVR